MHTDMFQLQHVEEDSLTTGDSHACVCAYSMFQLHVEEDSLTMQWRLPRIQTFSSYNTLRKSHWPLEISPRKTH